MHAAGDRPPAGCIHVYIRMPTVGSPQILSSCLTRPGLDLSLVEEEDDESRCHSEDGCKALTSELLSIVVFVLFMLHQTCAWRTRRHEEGRKEGRKITHPWQPTRLNGWNSVCACHQHDILSRQAMRYLLTMGRFLAHTSLAMTPEHSAINGENSSLRSARAGHSKSMCLSSPKAPV